jgi:hypothetical protein
MMLCSLLCVLFLCVFCLVPQHQMVDSTSSSSKAVSEPAPAGQALLPTTVDPAEQKEEQPATGFPHEFRWELCSCLLILQCEVIFSVR